MFVSLVSMRAKASRNGSSFKIRPPGTKSQLLAGSLLRMPTRTGPARTRTIRSMETSGAKWMTVHRSRSLSGCGLGDGLDMTEIERSLFPRAGRGLLAVICRRSAIIGNASVEENPLRLGRSILDAGRRNRMRLVGHGLALFRKLCGNGGGWRDVQQRDDWNERQ